jgi:hypothetical protein
MTKEKRGNGKCLTAWFPIVPCSIKLRCCSVEGVVDLGDDVSGTDRAIVKAASVETLHGLLAALDVAELDVNVAIRVRVDCDVNDLSVLLRALALDIHLKVFGPVNAAILKLPIISVSMCSIQCQCTSE